MSIRGRMTAVCAAVVGVIVIGASIGCYLAMRGELRGQVDDQLRTQSALARLGPLVRARPVGAPETVRVQIPELPARLGAGPAYVQLVRPDGTVDRPRGDDLLIPVTDADRVVHEGTMLTDRKVEGVHLRVATTRLADGGTLQIARSLATIDEALSQLRTVLAILCATGIALAVLAGRRLGARFAASHDALTESLAKQRQLVADASHELRTPVTSLRTNAELLREGEVEAAEVADDVVEQAEELSLLVGDLIELARGDAREPEAEDVRLDVLVREAVERARRHAPRIAFELEAEPVVVEGAPERLARAVNNLLDNAAKYSPADGRVEVRVAGRGVTIRDHGPGVDPEEVPLLFDRFHRGAAANGHTGSGLGLAIVKQVADAHGAEVSLTPAPGGGTLARLDFAGH